MICRQFFLFTAIVGVSTAIECYTGLKLIAGQTVGQQTIKCGNAGAQCYNMTVAGTGGILDVMKSGCSLWRCIATRDSCIGTTFQGIPIKFCCCSTHLCNIDKNAAGLVNQKVGGWNAEPGEQEGDAVMKVLGSDNAEKPAINMTLEEMREYMQKFDVDAGVDNTTSTTTMTPTLGADVEI